MTTMLYNEKRTNQVGWPDPHNRLETIQALAGRNQDDGQQLILATALSSQDISDGVLDEIVPQVGPRHFSKPILSDFANYCLAGIEAYGHADLDTVIRLLGNKHRQPLIEITISTIESLSELIDDIDVEQALHYLDKLEIDNQTKLRLTG